MSLTDWLPLIGLFLVADGVVSIAVHPDGPPAEQVLRGLRALIGVGLVVTYSS